MTDTPEAPETDTLEDTPDTEPNAEAKKYRLRLRDTEAQLADVQQQLDGIQRQVVAQLVEDECSISPEVLWAAGTNMSDLTESDGSVNRDAVRQAGDQAAQALNVARGPRRPKPDPMQGQSSGYIGRGGWTGAFTPR